MTRLSLNLHKNRYGTITFLLGEHMKKFILFDNDGVLVETEPLYFEASQKALKEFFDLDLDFDTYMEIMARGGTAWEPAQQKGIPEQEIVTARTKRNIYYQEFIQTRDIAIPNVKEILKELSHEYKMAIITTSRRVDFELIHNGRGITDFMDFILCEGEYARSKPAPDPYLEGLARFGGKKHEAIIVEDSQRGLTSAVGAGIECIIVHNEFTATHNFSNATKKIQTLSELLEKPIL